MMDKEMRDFYDFILDVIEEEFKQDGWQLMSSMYEDTIRGVKTYNDLWEVDMSIELSPSDFYIPYLEGWVFIVPKDKEIGRLLDDNIGKVIDKLEEYVYNDIEGFRAALYHRGHGFQVNLEKQNLKNLYRFASADVFSPSEARLTRPIEKYINDFWEDIMVDLDDIISKLNSILSNYDIEV